MPFKKKEDGRSAGVDDIQFFSDVDMKWDKGESRITATYPAWYFKTQFEAEKEEVRRRNAKQPRVDGVVYSNDAEIAPEYIDETRKMQARVKEVEESKPKLNGAQKNFLTRSVSEIDSQIQSSMFTYDDMNTGVASAHAELDRQLKPCITIDKRLADQLNLKSFKGGKVSRDDATIASQIIHSAMDDEHSVEGMRPRNLTFRTQRVTPFTGNVSANEVEIMEIQDGREAATSATA